MANTVGIENSTCPLERLSEEQASTIAELVAKADKDVPDEQIQALAIAVVECANQFGWSKAESEQVTEFNISVLGVVHLETLLTEAGVDIAKIENLLDGQSSEALQKMIDAPEENELIDAATEELLAQKGDDATGEMGGFVGAYMVLSAKAQLIAEKILADGA